MSGDTRSLFDELIDSERDDSRLVPVDVRRPADKREQAVNRLLKKVDALRSEIERERRRLDEALVFHAAHVAPRIQRVADSRADLVRALSPFLDDRRLKKKERDGLRAVVIEQLDEVLAHSGSPDETMRSAFERVHGISFSDAQQEELAGVRAEMEDALGDLGIDIDVPDLRADMSDEEFAAAAASMAEQLHEQAEREREREEARANRRRGKRPTKRALQAQERARRWDELRKVGICAVYKRLVKALHPDLEQDAAERTRKSEVMQEVTTAYRRNDLHALLRLEAQWLDADLRASEADAAVTLDAYAALLKQQITELQTEYSGLLYEPKYLPIVQTTWPFGVAVMADGPSEVARLDRMVGDLGRALERLSGEKALEEVRDLVRYYQTASRRRAPVRR